MPGKKFHIPIIQEQITNEVPSCSNNNINNDDDDDHDANTNAKIKVAFKQEFIHHVKPIIQEMEHRKETDLLEARSATMCEMHKNKGKCYYFDMYTGEEVDPREYEERYLRWIEWRRGERLDGRRRSRKIDIDVNRESDDDDDDKVGNGNDVGQDDKELMLSSSSSPQSRLEEVKEEEEAFHYETSFEDQSVNMDDSMMSSVASSSSVDDSMSEVAVAPSKITASAAAAATTTTSTTSTIIGNNTTGAGAASKNDIIDNTSNSNCGSSSILGLPSLLPSNHGQESNDIRVLEARKKLWRAIDVALENYSKEVLAIQQGS